MTPEELAALAEAEARRKQMIDDLYKQYKGTEDILRLEERIGAELLNHNKSIANYLDGQTSIKKKILERNKANQALSEMINEQTKLMALQESLGKDLSATDEARLKYVTEIVNQSKNTINLLNQEITMLQQGLSFWKSIGNELFEGAKSLAQQHFSFMEIWNYLQKIDKAIRMNQLNLGVSGEKAKMMREQLEGSVNAAAYLGATEKDILDVQEAIAAQTGRAFAFRMEENLMLMQIVKGTGMANEEAGKLVGTMMDFGLNVESARDIIEGSVNSTAKLGLSSANVLKKLGANIDKLNSYRFQNGIKGLEQMVKYSETLKISMETSFAAAEKFRTLEGLLETGANLRVLGGEFAKMDEFKLSFLARNKPEEFTKELAKLTKGMASFNKETGTFELSDIDFDRARAAAEATGTDFNNLVQAAKAVGQIDFAKKQILIGNDTDKEMIANLARFKPGSTIGTIQVGKESVKLTELTEKHLEALRNEQKTLKQRTIDSQNFNDALTNLVTQLKATLIPALEVINGVLGFFNSLVTGLRDENGKLHGLLSIIPLGGMLVSAKLMSSLWSWLAAAIAARKSGTVASIAQSAYGVSGGQIGPALPNQGGAAGAVSGMSAAKMAAIGVAAMGIGAGLYFAAKGASALADSLAKLNSDQTTTLIATMSILGATIGGTLVGGIFLLGKVGAAAAPELYALGGAVALIGGGIGIAAAGIGYMINGMANLVSTIPNTINSMTNLASVDVSNLTKVGKELTSMSTISVNNLIPLQNLKFVDKDIENMKQMAALLAQINSIDTSKLNALGKLFSSGTMKVQLEGNPTIRIDNRIDVDGTIFYKKVEKAVPIIIKKGFDTRSLDWNNL